MGGCLTQQQKQLDVLKKQTSSMLPSHLTNTTSIHTVVTASDKPRPSGTQLTVRDWSENGRRGEKSLWSGQQDGNRAVSFLASWNIDTLLWCPFGIHLLIFHYESCSLTSLLFMENEGKLNNICWYAFCCCLCWCGNHHGFYYYYWVTSGAQSHYFRLTTGLWIAHYT